MKRLGFTRKKLKFVALQRSDVLRAEYQAEVSMYNSDMFCLLMRLAVTVKMLLENSDIHSMDFQPRAFNFFMRKKDFNNWANVNNHFFRLLHN